MSAEDMANYRAARALMGKGKSSAKKGANQRNDPGDRLQRNEEVLMLSKPSLRGATAKYQIPRTQNFRSLDVNPSPILVSEFQSFPLSPIRQWFR